MASSTASRAEPQLQQQNNSKTTAAAAARATAKATAKAKAKATRRTRNLQKNPAKPHSSRIFHSDSRSNWGGGTASSTATATASGGMRCILRETSRGVGAPARVVSALTPASVCHTPSSILGGYFCLSLFIFFDPEPWGNCSIPCSILAEYFFLDPYMNFIWVFIFYCFLIPIILLFDPPPLLVHSDHLVRIQTGKVFLSPSDASEWLRLDNWQFWQTCTHGCAPGS